MNPSLDTLPPPALTGTPPAADAIHETREWNGLGKEAEQIGVPLSDRMLARFDTYRAILLDRNVHVNLTAITDPSEVERRLFLDALAMIPEIDKFLRGAAQLRGQSVRLIDIGSGAGFPGIALKIARPELEVVLLDATAKKVAFQRDVIESLELSEIEAIHDRAENLARDACYRGAFQLATARAVASLPALLELATPFLCIGGLAMLPKGLQIGDELKAGRRAARQLGCKVIDAELMPGGTSRLVRVRKISQTPPAFPRRPGVPNRLPLGGGGRVA